MGRCMNWHPSASSGDDQKNGIRTVNIRGGGGGLNRKKEKTMKNLSESVLIASSNLKRRFPFAEDLSEGRDLVQKKGVSEQARGHTGGRTASMSKCFNRPQAQKN